MKLHYKLKSELLKNVRTPLVENLTLMQLYSHIDIFLVMKISNFVFHSLN